MKKISMCFILLLAFLAGCGPISLVLTNTPTIEITSTSAMPTVTPVTESTIFPTLPPPNVQEAQLTEINMMDETSGWAWGIDRAYQSYMLHTTDRGQTWENVTPKQNLLLGTYSSFMLDAQTAWTILADESLARTLDGGKTWQVIHSNLRDELVSPFRDWYRLLFANADHGWLVTGYTAAGAHELFYETQDGGVTWDPLDFERLPEGLYNNGNYKNELAFWNVIDVIYYDSEKFMIAMGEQEDALEISLSTDRGRSWKTVPLPASSFSDRSFEPFDRKIHAPVFFDPQHGVLSVGILHRYEDTFDLFVYGTSDGGLTWTLNGRSLLATDGRSDISFLSPHEAVFVCGTNLCKTSDSGNTWQKTELGISIPDDPDHTSLKLSFVNPDTGWLLISTNNAEGIWVSARLYETTDGGLTWTEVLPVIRP